MIKKIYKFGGASVKDADAVRNLADIVSQHKDEDILLVVSATRGFRHGQNDKRPRKSIGQLP